MIAMTTLWQDLSQAVMEKLPGHYLLLVGLVAGLGYFVHVENRHREDIYRPLLNSCLELMQRGR
jgi:hypothetical protein